jgi:hypothetical protein
MVYLIGMLRKKIIFSEKTFYLPISSSIKDNVFLAIIIRAVHKSKVYGSCLENQPIKIVAFKENQCCLITIDHFTGLRLSTPSRVLRRNLDYQIAQSYHFY